MHAHAQAFAKSVVGPRAGKAADGLGVAVQDAHVVSAVHVGVPAAGRFDAPVVVAVAVGEGVGGVEVHLVHRTRDVASDAVALRQRVGRIAVSLGMGIAFVAALGFIFLVGVTGQSPRLDAEVARGADGDQATSVAYPVCDLVFVSVIDTVPTTGQNHHVVRVPIEVIQAAHRRHRVVPLLFKRVPHFPKAQGGDVVAHHHGHAGSRNVRHVVGAEVGTGVHHAAFQSAHSHAGHAGGQLGQPLAHAVPQGFVVATGDHHRSAWVGRSVGHDGALCDTGGDAVAQQCREHRGAQVGFVVKDVRVSWPFAAQISGPRVHGPRLRGRHRAGQGVGLEAVSVGQCPRRDVVGQAVAQLGVGVHEHLQQAGLGLPCIDDQIAFTHREFLSPHVRVVQSSGFGT